MAHIDLCIVFVYMPMPNRRRQTRRRRSIRRLSRRRMAAGGERWDALKSRFTVPKFASLREGWSSLKNKLTPRTSMRDRWDNFKKRFTRTKGVSGVNPGASPGAAPAVPKELLSHPIEIEKEYLGGGKRTKKSVKKKNHKSRKSRPRSRRRHV